jgi:hypothetical protein
MTSIESQHVLLTPSRYTGPVLVTLRVTIANRGTCSCRTQTSGSKCLPRSLPRGSLIGEAPLSQGSCGEPGFVGVDDHLDAVAQAELGQDPGDVGSGRGVRPARWDYVRPHSRTTQAPTGSSADS